MFLIAASPLLAYALSGCRRSCRGGPPAFLDAGAAAAGRLCRRFPDPTLGVVSGRRGLDEGLSPTVAAAGQHRLPHAREPADPSPALAAPRLLVALLGCGESQRACGRARPLLVSQGHGRADRLGRRALGAGSEAAAMRQPGRRFPSHFDVISQLGTAPPGLQAAFKSVSPDDPGPGSESASVSFFQPSSASRPTLHRLAPGHASVLAAWHRSSQLNGAHCGAAGHRQAPDAPAS